MKFRFILMFFPLLAWAGAQKEESLSVNVSTALSQAVSDKHVEIPEVMKTSFNQWAYNKEVIIRRKLLSKDEKRDLLESIYYESMRANLNPDLVLALIEVESGFNKYAVSSVGARGFMQVMPFWTRSLKANNANLFHLRTNLRFGCTILRHYLDLEKDNLFMALGRYNGSRGKNEYPNLVFGALNKHTKMVTSTILTSHSTKK